MTSRHLVDPEIAPLLDVFPLLEPSDETIGTIRAMMDAPKPDQPLPAIAPQRLSIPGYDGATDVSILLFDPPQRRSAGAILHIHAGGMIMGSADSSTLANAAWAMQLGVPVVSVDYRLAPECAFPGPQQDCLAAYDWLLAQAEALAIDPGRIAILGESAGGGLAAALTLMARDLGRTMPCAQFLIYPMLDHRTGSEAKPGLAFTGEFIWTRHANRYGWSALRGNYACADDRAGWFSPALAADLSGLPPTFIAAGSLDLFLEEDLDFAKRLVAAGTPVELHVHPGGYHAFDLVATSGIAQRHGSDLGAALARALGG